MIHSGSNVAADTQDTRMIDIKNPFRRQSPVEVAAAELAEAELNHLRAYTAMEYAGFMVDYEDARIKRLRKFLANSEKQA
jgi:hypothetical protein